MDVKRRIRVLKSYLRYFLFKILPYRSMVNNTGDNKNLIVSLTSFPGRFSTLDVVLKSIMYQSIRPDRVILHFDEDDDISLLPQKVIRLKRYGLEIETHAGRLRSHKKYYYSMLENPEATIITIDDDALYNRNMIKELLDSNRRYPNEISARRVHRILLDAEGKLKPYDEWDQLCTSVPGPSNRLLFTGVGGVLYPPECLHKDVFDTELILKLAARQDDIWLAIQALRNNTGIVWAPTRHIEQVLIPNSQKVGLYQLNVDDNANDVCIDALSRYYGIDWNKIDT